MNFSPLSSARGTAKKRCARRLRGSTLVEFALVLPVILAMIMGVIEWSWMARTQLAISNAAREGIRHAALGNSSTNVRTRIINAASQLSPRITTSQIVLTQTSDRTSSTPAYTAWPADTANASGASRNGVPAGNIIQVQINYPHTSLTGFFPFMNNRTVTVVANMSREATG